jgi:hypothetical protein
MANGRCRMHGGCSTGPRTPEGLERCRRAATKHGRRSAAEMAYRRQMGAEMRAVRQAVSELKREVAEYLAGRQR